MVKVTEKIKAAIREAGENLGSLVEIERRSKISHSQLSRYLSGYTQVMNDATWAALYPHIKDHLPPEMAHMIPGNPQVMLKSDFDRPDSEVRSANGRKFRAVPVLSFAQAAGFEPALEPLCDYLREHSDRQQMFVDVPDTYFALEVNGDSMSPDYPSGSIALVAAGEFPERGDIVVAKLATGQVVIKEYNRKDNVVTLSSRNPAGQTFQWHVKEKPGFVVWMWPVVEIILKPREQRHREKGV